MTLLLGCIILRPSCVNLSDNATPDQMNDFLEEITLMKAVGSHKNIVNLIGCCTKSSPNFLIVEYAAKGDLLSYLRERRKKVNALGYPEFKQNECLCSFLNEILSNRKLSKCELQIQVLFKDQQLMAHVRSHPDKITGVDRITLPWSPLLQW